MSNQYAAVWIDHHEAKVFHVNVATFDAKTIHAPNHHVRHSEVTREREHPAEAKHYYHDVAKVLADAAKILIVGPGTAKLELVRHLQVREPTIASKIIGLETVDHPTEGQLVAYVRQYFRAHGGMR